MTLRVGGVYSCDAFAKINCKRTRSAKTAMSSKVCRLCRSVVAPNRAVQLFSPTALLQQCPSRVTALLDVPVKKDEGHSACMCEKCKTRIQSHEKSAEDLAAFKEMARCSRRALEPRGPLKRAKATSGEVGVSPETMKQRPCSKLSRKRLDFDSE